MGARRAPLGAVCSVANRVIWKCWLKAATALAIALWCATAGAASFDVSSTADDGSPGTLRWAIEQANGAGAGNHTITFSVGANSIIEIDDPLPDLDNTGATIELDGVGAGGVTISGHDNHRVLFVAAGIWYVRNVNIVHGLAEGGDGGNANAGGGGGGLGAGGAVFVNSGASLIIQDVNFHDNNAAGGDGGAPVGGANGGGGGGGGMGGDGGNGSAFGGGGGGGIHGDGGNAGSNSGGGGGGIVLDGLPGIGPFGGLGAPLGGNGGNLGQPGQGGFPFGGGGGGGESEGGGAGGSFGGGGGAGDLDTGGQGGFGGGGGGGLTAGSGGFGAGEGGSGSQGDGGSGYGGAVFVREGGSFTILDSTTSGNGVAEGSGATNGNAAGGDLYLMNGVNATFAGTENTYNGSIAGEGSISVQSGSTTNLWGHNSYSGGTTVTSGRLNGDTDSLQRNITNNDEVNFEQTSNGTYSGAITGSGDLIKTGSADLRITNTGNSQSNIIIDDGALIGTTSTINAPHIQNDSTLEYDQNFDGSTGALITGSGNLAKDGSGSVSLTNDNTYTGRTDIFDGRLAINGSITSDTWVGSDGTLGGNGTIDGNVNNFGTVNAGNSIGTLSVTGDYTVHAGATHEVEINAGGTTPGVNNDLVDVSGTAFLQGGTVEVQAAAGSYSAGSTYTFLTANEIDGLFGGVSVTGLTDLHAILGYDFTFGSSSAFFTLFENHTNFLSIAKTFNERQAAMYLDRESGAATGVFRDILDTTAMLPVHQQRVALNQMTGVVNVSMSQLGVQDTTYLYLLLRRRVGSAFAAGGLLGGGGDGLAADDGAGSSQDAGLIVPVSYNSTSSTGGGAYSPYPAPHSSQPSWGGWMTGYGFGGSAQSDGNAAGGTYGSGGTIIAIERPLDDSSLLGFFGAYSYLGLSLDTLPQSASANQGLVGSYFLRDWGDSYFLGAGSVGFAGYNETRQLDFGIVNATARADYDGWQPTLYTEYGRRWQYGATAIQPYGALQYIYLRQNGFTESGAGVLNLDVAGIDTHALRGLLGARASQVWYTPSGRAWVPELRAVWMHEFLELKSTLTAVFAPIGGSSFATRGLNFGRDWAILGAGTQYVLSDQVSLFVNYDLLLNGQQVWNAGSGGFQYAW